MKTEIWQRIPGYEAHILGADDVATWQATPDEFFVGKLFGNSVGGVQVRLHFSPTPSEARAALRMPENFEHVHTKDQVHEFMRAPQWFHDQVKQAGPPRGWRIEFAFLHKTRVSMQASEGSAGQWADYMITDPTGTKSYWTAFEKVDEVEWDLKLVDDVPTMRNRILGLAKQRGLLYPYAVDEHVLAEANRHAPRWAVVSAGSSGWIRITTAPHCIIGRSDQWPLEFTREVGWTRFFELVKKHWLETGVDADQFDDPPTTDAGESPRGLQVHDRVRGNTSGQLARVTEVREDGRVRVKYDKRRGWTKAWRAPTGFTIVEDASSDTTPATASPESSEEATVAPAFRPGDLVLCLVEDEIRGSFRGIVVETDTDGNDPPAESLWVRNAYKAIESVEIANCCLVKKREEL